MQKRLSGVLVLLLALGSVAHAQQRARPVKVERKVMPMTRTTLRQVFPHQREDQINHELRAGRWQPDKAWLTNKAPKYGRLLIVSDLHPSTGRDQTTRRVNPAEDFKNDQQEVDFRSMMEGQWAEGKADGRVRTLVLNGDTLEFMQTDRTPIETTFVGKSDAYGPLNTPENVAKKLAAIYDGHPQLFGTYAEHMYRGNRVVLIPGNHDRQLLHPTVRNTFKRLLMRDIAALYVRDPKFAAGAGNHKREKLAMLEAKKVLAERFEFSPWFFMHGDVVARHGHETDRFNSFSSPFADYYHPTAKGDPMEAALGDYIVKAVFNKVERRKPWTDNTSNHWEVAKAVIGAADGNPVKMVKFLRYLLTREGSNFRGNAVAKVRKQIETDVRRYVREGGLVEKFNDIRPANDKLSEDEVISKLLHYESSAAKPALSHYQKGSGALRRLGTLAGRLPAMLKQKKSPQVEQEMADKLFEEYVSTLAVGHDHKYRMENRLVVDSNGNPSKAEVLDSATWTDQTDEIRRDLGFTPAQRRGIIVVDFDQAGSHPKLMNYDPKRGLQMVNVLETEEEAQTR